MKKSYFNWYHLLITITMLHNWIDYAKNLLYCGEFDHYFISVVQVTNSACVKRYVFPIFLLLASKTQLALSLRRKSCKLCLVKIIKYVTNDLTFGSHLTAKWAVLQDLKVINEKPFWVNCYIENYLEPLQMCSIGYRELSIWVLYPLFKTRESNTTSLITLGCQSKLLR